MHNIVLVSLIVLLRELTINFFSWCIPIHRHSNESTHTGILCKGLDYNINDKVIYRSLCIDVTGARNVSG